MIFNGGRERCLFVAVLRPGNSAACPDLVAILDRMPAKLRAAFS
jgi:hypothetical protein